jgi:hypothetical protein
MYQFDRVGLQVRCEVLAPSAAEIVHHSYRRTALDERIHER